MILYALVELMDEVNSILNSLHPLILRKFLNTRENRELKMKDELKSRIFNERFQMEMIE